MSVIAPPLIAPRRVRLRASEHRARRRAVSAATVETVVLWAIALAGYAWLGHRVVVQQHVVIFDAAARLAHAFFVWYNAPPKLAAIGFVWAPMSTLVFLPLAAIKPLATSLLALPLTSAMFGAGLLAVLNRTLALFEIRWPWRYAIVAAFGLNPMIMFYASNGMSESAYLFFLMAGIYFLLRWYLSRNSHFLVLASMPFALAILSRYELVVYVGIVALTISVVLRGRRARREAMREAALICFLLPIVYGIGLWTFFNWVIIGDPLFWLRNQAPGAGGQQSGMIAVQHFTGMTPAHIAQQVVAMNFRLFPFAVVIVPVLALLWVRRRDAMTACLGLFMVANPVTTAGLMLMSKQEGFLQLRYNMRAMPIAIVAAGWVVYSLKRPAARTLGSVAILAGLLVSFPVTWHAMRTYPYQYEESTFLTAITTGKDLEGTTSVPGGYHVGIKEERQMADYILSHVHRRDAVLTDDAQSFEVMLVSGRPDLFLDRIDYGDTAWTRVLDHPFGRVRYFLVSTFAPTLDLIQVRFTGIAKGLPWARVVYANGRYELLAIPRCPPGNPSFGLRIPAGCAARGGYGPPVLKETVR